MVNLAGFMEFFHYVAANWQNVIIVSLLIVCSVIAALGGLKPLLFNRIKNKTVRKLLLAVSSLVLIMPFAALLFIFDSVKFNYYWYWVICLCPVMIIVYWLYEITALRNLVDFIGQHTLKRLGIFLATELVDADNRATKEKLIAENKELKDYAKTQVKSALLKRNKDSELDEI